MSEYEIREPIQKRSIEKKERIIKSGFELICQKGYYNTNTAEIAKKAGVSTGIVYQYFKDKHDIFISGLEKYADTIFYPIPNINKADFKEKDFSDILKYIIKAFISDHKLSESAHEEITAMVHSDKDVAYFFYKREMEMTVSFSNMLKENNFNEITCVAFNINNFVLSIKNDYKGNECDSSIFPIMESNKETLFIEEYSYTLTTFEKIFLENYG